MSSIECFRSKNIIYLTNSLVLYWFCVTLNCILGNACDGEEGNIKGKEEWLQSIRSLLKILGLRHTISTEAKEK